MKSSFSALILIHGSWAREPWNNGCNSALVIEAARAIKATGLLPRRTIRFVLFSGEEQGTIGSFEYVKAHRAELAKTAR